MFEGREIDIENGKCSQQSVYNLITNLCRSIAAENGFFNDNHEIVSKMRSLAYEALLHKSSSSYTLSKSNKENVYRDSLRELDEHFFAARLNAKARGENSTDLDEINSLLSIAGSYFLTKQGNDVLQLLLALKSTQEMEVPSTNHRELLVPGAFSLHAPYQHNRYYPKKFKLLPKNAEPKYFRSMKKMQEIAKNGFVPFQKDLRSPLFQKMNVKNVKSKITPALNDTDADCSFTGLTRRHICSDADWLRIDMRSLQFNIRKSTDFYAAQLSIITHKPLRAGETSESKRNIQQNVEESALHTLIEPRRSLSWNWDQRGSKNGIQCAKPFVSDVNIPFELQGLASQEQNKTFQAKVIKNEEFLRDLKLLTVGLQSDTFYLNEEIFCALPDVTVPNVLPATIRNYVQEFLECGTCFKRLHKLTSKRNHRHVYDGFIFKAFCAAVDEYLLTFRQFVFSYKNEETLISLYKRLKQAMKQIQNLSLTLGVTPGVDANARLPKGSQFLGYLYREIIRLTDNEYITLLMFLLKRCCHVYFKFLQLWIFHGILDDPSKELFIHFIDHYRKDTKHFYDKAYVIHREAVPGFFQNHEDRILQCGKYTMLLKAYSPNHPLFDLEYPKIAVRLSFEEIQKLEESCANYAEKAREICGKPITVKDVFDARAKRRAEYQNLVFQRTRENIERWNLEQQKITQKIAEGKRKRLEELSARLEEDKQNRIEKRRRSVELELKALREAQKHNDDSLQRENINLRKRIEYYQELSDTLRSTDTDTESSIYTKRRRRHSVSGESDSEALQSSRTATNSVYSFSTMKKDSDADSLTEYNSSKTFEAEFAKTAEELHKYLEKKSEEYNTNNNCFENAISAKDKEKYPSEHSIAGEGEFKTLHRSISDVINSNLPQEIDSGLPISDVDNRSALQMNRLKTLTGTIGLCLNEDRNAKTQLIYKRKPPSDVLRVTFQKDVPLPDINLNMVQDAALSELDRNRKRMKDSSYHVFQQIKSPTDENKLESAAEPVTDLERNRQKVLTEEYGFHKENKVNFSHTDIHTLPEDMLSDMQRNRRRMMDSPNPFTEYNKPALSDRPKLNLTLNTDRARNRRKVLESEYNILTGDENTTRELLTPMSTTSDPPISESGDQKSDLVNGNLRLNILGETDTAAQPSTAATQPPTTPFDALTSAGVRARSGGFHFTQTQKELEASQNASSFLNLTSDYDELDSTLEHIKCMSPYEWCKDLIKSKFKSANKNSMFRLNLGSPYQEEYQKESSSTAHSIRNFKIDSLSVITLTEFLQKSITMPMNTHMDIVNGEVMRVLLQDLHLINHFRSLRNYFFLMDGEFGSIICDGIIGHVESGDKPTKVLSYQMLHMILDNALSFSIHKDNNAENLSFIVSEIPSKFDLNSPSVLNVLSLSYRVKWPLNLILNNETLEQYGNIFKYLLKVRRISWVLEKAFELLRQAAKRHGKRLLRSVQYLRIQQIRHKFYHFVHSLQNHIAATALQASWKLFKDELIHAKSLEDIYRMHTQYVKRIMFLCMLNRSSSEFNNAIENIFKISLKFYNNLKSREFTQNEGTKEFTHARFKKMVTEEEEFEKFLKYTIYLGNKIVRRGYQAEIGEFITLININKYYTTQTTAEGTSKTNDQLA